ncbi:MAG: glycosyltransferase family 4 protein [Rhodothermales bacterium]
MNILFVTHSFPPPDRPLDNVGGMQRVAFELDAALRRQVARGDASFSYETRALVSSWRWVHVKVVPFLFGTWRLLARQIRRRDVDVVVFSSMVTAALAVPLSGLLRKHGVATAAIVHGQDVTKPVRAWQGLVSRVFEAVDVVMPVSGATGEACVERGLPPEKVAVVHNGVDLDRFNAVLDRLAARGTRISADRARLNESSAESTDASPLLLCSVGRQVKRKGFAWFIRNVMPALPPHVHYWLGGDGPEHDDIQAAIRETGLEARVRLLGRLDEDELIDLYRCSDLFIMPNIPVPGDMEGFGIVMLEAGLSGLPTVAARLEGIREVITPGENGYFVESGDAAGFADRISALDADRSALADLSERTVGHVRSTFGWDAVAGNYLAVLSRVSNH